MAYEAREQSELLFYEADARRRAALRTVEQLTPMQRVDLRTAGELAPLIASAHEHLQNETRVVLRFAERVHEMQSLITRWRRVLNGSRRAERDP